MKQYCDRVWLENQYVNGMPIYQIAEKAGCGYNTVRRWLKRFDISQRLRSEINGKKTGPVPCSIPEQFLQKRYIEQEQSMTQIAEEIGINQTTVRNRLLSYSIPIRNQHDCKPANHVKLTEDLLEYLDGTLLGDGCLVAKTDLSAYYTIAQKHLSYILWVSSYLSDLGLEQVGQINHWQSPKSPNLTYHYNSRYYRELRKQYNRWYPDGKKHIPEDVRLTPMSIRTWFLEDGSYDVRNRVRFAACGFMKEGVDILANGLREVLNTLHIHTNMQGYISFSRKEIVRRFFDYILPLPEELEEDYGYKYHIIGGNI